MINIYKIVYYIISVIKIRKLHAVYEWVSDYDHIRSIYVIYRKKII